MGGVVSFVQKLLQNDLIAKFIKFGVVGFSGMLVDYGVLFVCRELLGIPDLLSNSISFTVAASSNYVLNRIWTFRSEEKQVGVEYAKFFAVSLVGLGISNLTLWGFGKKLPEWSEDYRFYILKFFAIVVTTMWNFLGNILFTFRHR